MKEKDYAYWVKLSSSLTLVLASTMVAAKFWAWMSTGSTTMLGSLTDSLLDITASAINFWVLRIALVPADDDHRFGHGKAESLVGLGQAAFIAGSACLLAFYGVERLFNPVKSEAVFTGVVVSIYALVCTLLIIVIQHWALKQTKSVAIKADSVHYKGDLLLNLSVIVALVLANIGWVYSDGVFTLLIAGYLFYNAYDVAKESTDYLMDKELADDIKLQIEQAVLSHSEVLGFHELRTRQSGPTKFIQLHLELDSNLTLANAHRISVEVEEAIHSIMDGEVDVLIHKDPF
ncbi:cation diffusion facilitator family transporter [Pseudoalteromonas sp. P1-9]|uniref:cation diffusion facilitator family transporter n=1 Tax=Pseudoalteromonas sp. P1-9 TaxID=1710354 RepID=UPI0009E7A51C|nr:cation diffusion facilitator family transporter [Pseudoalteromonas sp. P1-9]